MRLYLMRHGQAANPKEDPERGLTATGRAEIENLAQRLADKGVSFKQVLHSKKARAQQTAEIMATKLAPGVTPQMRRGLKPDDDPAEFIPEIDCLDEDTLIASHLPFVPNLLQALTGQTQSSGFVPGTVICLLKDNGSWKIEWIEVPN